ncbi:MAG: sensor histidine kinase [Deltaproteobacteria bacterium]|nr:sensor histidine kinase [Deltaproteobacteria bacterium]
MGLLLVGLLILIVPSWSRMMGLRGVLGYVWYVFMALYSTANFYVMDRGRVGRWFTFGTLNLDLLALLYLIVASGALRSPFLPIQLIFTLFFAMLFPKPGGIIPPLMLLPIIAHFDQLVYERGFVTQDIFILIFYSVLNLIIVYVIVYLSDREEQQQREIVALTRELKDLAVHEERQRISREMHDGLGALLSSLIIQSDYVNACTADEALKKEIAEIKGTAEESIEELRRCVQMMRDDFDLRKALEDYCAAFQQRSRVEIEFFMPRREFGIRPDQQLVLFRVLQEALSNAVKHGAPAKVRVSLSEVDSALMLKVQDDGKGFAWTGGVSGHYGLANMQERARKAGGTCEITSEPGHGTLVTLRIPLSGGME